MKNSQGEMILENVKQAMKAGDFTYRDLAKYLKVSEPTVKRMFSQKQLTLSRLEQICEFLGVTIRDLSSTEVENANGPYILSEAQDFYFSENLSAWKFFITFLGNRSIEKTIKAIGVSSSQASKWLASLESLRLIRWEDGMKARLIVSSHIKMRPKGELRSKLISHMMRQYINRDRQESGVVVEEFLGCLLSEKSTEEYEKKLTALLKEIRHTSDLERKLGVKQRSLEMIFVIQDSSWGKL